MEGYGRLWQVKIFGHPRFNALTYQRINVITLSRRSRAIVSFSACQLFSFCSKTPFFQSI